jgi:hypothetical protein
MTNVIVCVVIAFVVGLIGYVIGRATAPKEITVIHPWPKKHRCPEILGGMAMEQCRYRRRHAGPHRAYFDDRDWAFKSGTKLVEYDLHLHRRWLCHETG